MTFKVGIVGYGVVGKRRHNALKNIVDFKVTALSDINFNTGNELPDLKCYSNFKELIKSKNYSRNF